MGYPLSFFFSLFLSCTVLTHQLPPHFSSSCLDQYERITESKVSNKHQKADQKKNTVLFLLFLPVSSFPFPPFVRSTSVCTNSPPRKVFLFCSHGSLLFHKTSICCLSLSNKYFFLFFVSFFLILFLSFPLFSFLFCPGFSFLYLSSLLSLSLSHYFLAALVLQPNAFVLVISNWIMNR